MIVTSVPRSDNLEVIQMRMRLNTCKYVLAKKCEEFCFKFIWVKGDIIKETFHLYILRDIFYIF